MRHAMFLLAGVLGLGGCSAIPGFVPEPALLSAPALPPGDYPTPAPVYGNPFAPNQAPQKP